MAKNAKNSKNSIKKEIKKILEAIDNSKCIKTEIDNDVKEEVFCQVMQKDDLKGLAVADVGNQLMKKLKGVGSSNTLEKLFKVANEQLIYWTNNFEDIPSSKKAIVSRLLISWVNTISDLEDKKNKFLSIQANILQSLVATISVSNRGGISMIKNPDVNEATNEMVEGAINEVIKFQTIDMENDNNASDYVPF